MMKSIDRTIDYLKYKIKDLKKRRPKLIDDFSKYAITMSIDELKEVLIGFMIELNEQNVSARDIGRELAKITELMRCRDA